MLCPVNITHLFSIVGTPNINVLLSLKSVQQNITETSVKVDFNSGNDFLKNVGFCGAWSSRVTRFL
jgi:hypothetical protein